MILVITYNFEDYLILAFLFFGSIVSGHKAKSNVLNKRSITSPCIPTKLLGLSFSYSMSLK